MDDIGPDDLPSPGARRIRRSRCAQRPPPLIASLRALPRALDPYCGVLGPKEFLTFEDGERAPFAGLEFPLSQSPQSAVNVFPGGNRLGDPIRPMRDGLPAGPIRIAAVQPGSPGQKADVRPGDLIVAIDGRPPEDPGFSAALQRMQPIRSGVAFDPRVAASPIKLRLLRPSRPEPVDVTVTPALFRIRNRVWRAAPAGRRVGLPAESRRPYRLHPDRTHPIAHAS